MAGSGRQCKISLRSLSRERMAVAMGQSTYFLRMLGLLGLQLMGINFKVPVACKPSDENCKPALMDSCMCFRGEGLQTQKDLQKLRKFSPQSSAPFQLATSGLAALAIL